MGIGLEKHGALVNEGSLLTLGFEYKRNDGRSSVCSYGSVFLSMFGNPGNRQEAERWVRTLITCHSFE